MKLSEMVGPPDALEFAGNMIERYDFQDQTPSLLELTGVAQSGIATASGLNDYDYQPLTSLSMGIKNLKQVETVNRVPIPNEIMEHFKHIKCHCMMGLFPEIGRAWLTIDSDIYIWTYEHSRDVAYFDGLSDLITTVGLVTPKPGVFIADVKHLLVLTTAVEIVVLGVTFEEAAQTVQSPTRSLVDFEEMQLLNKPIFVLSTDNVAISVVQGSASGRIFLGGKDGYLYEIAYQAESSWFGKRCKKINHSQGIISYVVPGFLKIFPDIDPITKICIDDSRNFLYVLTEKGAIEAWDMGLDSNQMRRIARVSANEIVNSASNILKTVEASVFKPVTTLCALTYADSPHLHLLAISHSGVRFFFSTAPLSYGQSPHMQHEQNRAQGLYLMHVRLPPGYTPNATVGKPKQVHAAFYKQGSLVMVSTPQQDQDLLWSISCEPFPFRPFLVESSTVLPLDGQVWAVGEVKEKKPTNIDSLIKLSQTPRKIALLTSQGVHIVALLKPVHLLRELLSACNGAQHEAVKAYFKAQSEPQACATSLSLACAEQVSNLQIAMWATQAFMLYGGEPHFGVVQQPQQHLPFPGSPLSSVGGSSSFYDPQQMQQMHQQQQQQQQQQQPMYMSTPFSALRPASSVQQSLMQQTQFPGSPIQSSSFNASIQEQTNLNFSAKHAGLYLHIARLLRPIWHRRCIDQKLNSTINQQDCTEVLIDLYAIKNFLDANSVAQVASYSSKSMNGNVPQATSPFASLYAQQQIIQRKTTEDAHSEEKRSLEALNRFIRHAAEVVALWKILCEHQFHILVSQLPKELQNILGACTFRDLILTRIDICAQLIVTLISTYLNDSASVTPISSKLREVCPNLYRHEDAVSHKATEILMLSKNCTDNDEKEERLKIALQLCKGAAPKLPLAQICQQFTNAGFYSGVIELCATCAAKIDPNETGLHFYRNQEPPEDKEGFIAYTTRREYYKEVKEMLETVYHNLINSNTTMNTTRGPMEEERERNISGNIIQIVNLALASQDKLLHHAVYEWLLQRDLLSELLGTSEPSLGEFLSRAVSRQPDNLKITDLLWKYHERNGQHAAAARILDNLASSDTDVINLQQRIEYLARAIMCMRSDSAGASAHNGILLKELEDKLDIARVQKQILDAIESMPPITITRDAVKSLNTCLFNMTHLWADFCEDFDLWECKLTIINYSHHNEPLLIESIWMQILDKEMEHPGTPMERATRLLSKVRRLAEEHNNGGTCFPLHFIVRELEVRCFRLKLMNSPVPDTLLAMNLNIDSLLDIYGSLISMNERIWTTEDDDLYLIRSTTKLLSLLTVQGNIINPKNRRRLVAKSEDLISACLNLLYSKPDPQKYIDDLREIQSKLKRIL